MQAEPRQAGPGLRITTWNGEYTGLLFPPWPLIGYSQRHQKPLWLPTMEPGEEIRGECSGNHSRISQVVHAEMLSRDL